MDICIRWLFRCVSLTQLELSGSEEQRELDDEFDKINQQEMEEARFHWDKQAFFIPNPEEINGVFSLWSFEVTKNLGND